MFLHQLQVLFFELIRHIEVGTVLYLLIGEELGWIIGIEQSFVGLCFQLVDEFGHHI